MKVKIWEVYSGDYCIGCKTKEMAQKQIVLSPVEYVASTILDITQVEENELEQQGYIWL